jgi:glycosyltransferase involved in cell wall biosynthesis
VRIAASIGVKDEVELIERTIAHIRAIGVDHIIACDMHSTDGTGEILEKYRSDDDFWLTQVSDGESQETWVRANLELVDKANADWVIFLDADEFPIPASGYLKECAALEYADAVTLDRFNVPLCQGQPPMPSALVPELYERLLLVVESIPDSEFWPYLEQNPNASWIRKQMMPRVMARPEKIAGLTLGTHDVVPTDQALLRRAKADDLLVSHLPFTTRSRFARKVENIRAYLLVHEDLFGPDSAQHWQRWVALADQGTLDQEFDRMIFDAEETAELHRKGVIRSAAEVFSERG